MPGPVICYFKGLGFRKYPDDRHDETLERIYLGRRFKKNNERLRLIGIPFPGGVRGEGGGVFGGRSSTKRLARRCREARQSNPSRFTMTSIHGRTSSGGHGGGACG